MQEILSNGARELLGIELSAAQLEQFEIYYQELVDWNSRINLTAITDYDEVQTRHFLDSLTLASARLRGDDSDTPFESLIDVGAGAGFPGVPLKILYPEMRLTLADSVGKKTSFLQSLADKLGLKDVTVLNKRAEELGQDRAHRERYQVATGRAVAALPVLAEYCLPLCKVGGLFIAPKKGDMAAELAMGRRAIPKLGGQMRPDLPLFDLPNETDSRRQLIVADKIKLTTPTYPRKVGIPAKQPL